jgi:hypothetical protein
MDRAALACWGGVGRMRKEMIKVFDNIILYIRLPSICD